MMDDWNVRRKARGRIRRAKNQRRRQRTTAAALMLLLLFTVFAVGSVNYGETRSQEIKVANQHKVTFSMPQIVPLLASTTSLKPSTRLPQILNFNERFPDYRNPPQVDDPGDRDNGGQNGPPQDRTRNMVILDDLRAAPPKTLFIDAVFEAAEGIAELEEIGPPTWLFADTFDSNPMLIGHPQNDDPMIPPVPQPGSGALLSLGLIGLAFRRSRDSRPAGGGLHG